MNLTTSGHNVPSRTFTNHRIHLRLPFVGVAEVTAMRTGQHLTAQVSEISSRGCYLETPDPLTASTKVHMRIRHEGSSCDLCGTVCYAHTGSGMGVVFDTKYTEAFDTLDNWLAELADTQTHGAGGNWVA
jgi:hypothetical protein